MAQAIEHEYFGGSKSRVWTFLILGTLLLVGLLAAEAAWQNPDQARAALHGFLGMPGWTLAGITAGVGLLIFYLGLKIEADWPEALGAAMISAAFLSGEIMLGLDHFELGRLALMPFILPLLLFATLFGVGMVKSK